MKRHEIDIINYLSGEMSPEDCIVFEQQIEANPALKAEVEALKSTQAALGSWADDEITVPEFIAPTVVSNVDKTKVLFFYRPWMKYAASIVALIGMLWLSGLQMTRSNTSVTLSFGPPSSQMDIDQKIDAAVSSALEKYGEKQRAQFTASMEALNNNVQGIENSVALISNNWKNEKSVIQKMMSNLSDQQYQKFASMIEQYQSNQDGKIDETFASLVDYLDDNRANDFFQIENAFSEIVAAMDDQQERTTAMFETLVPPVVTNY